MLIRKELRGFYPIDWSELSAVIRFERARGRCEGCGRPHGKVVCHLGGGRWFDPDVATWRNDRGREIVWPDYASARGRLQAAQLVLATAHLDHDPTNNRSDSLKALCQCYHLRHDRREHRRRSRITILRRRALGDLFDGPYSAWP